MRLSLSIIALLSLAACAYVPNAALMQFNAISPLEAHPEDIAVAVHLPDGLRVAPGSTQLVIKATTAGKSFREVFTLQQRPLNSAQVFQIAPADFDRLQTAQAKANQWESADPDGTSGSITVTTEFCTTGAGPAQDATASISLRSTRDGDFMPLVRNAPLAEITKSDALSTMQPC